MQVVLISILILIALAFVILGFAIVVVVAFRKKPYAVDRNRLFIEIDTPKTRQSKEWYFEQKEKNAFEDFEITSFDGLKLRGFFIPSDVKTNKLVIAFHGYTACGAREFSPFIKFYHDQNINMLIIEQRGHNFSEGRFISFGVFDRYDCRSWTEFAVQHFGNDVEIYLHGVSMGCATILLATELSLPQNVKGLIADCGYTSPMEQISYTVRNNFHVSKFPAVYIADFFCKIIAKWSFRDVSTLNAVAKCKIPTVFIHGEKDEYVLPKMTIRNYNASIAPKRLLIAPNAVHASSYYFATDEYERLVLELINGEIK